VRWLYWLGALGLLGTITGVDWLRLFYLLFLIPIIADVTEGKFSASYRRDLRMQINGQRRANARMRGGIARADAYRQKVKYTLPFRGEWVVVNGGVTRETSHSWRILSQRYAYDFVIQDATGRTYAGSGRDLTDYFAYGQDIVAPADGTVVAVHDVVREPPRVGRDWVDRTHGNLAGNYVTIQHADGEFSFLAHLIRGSICVGPGQHVKRGELIGKCGHSGNSSEPHLHFQVQDVADFHGAIGLPVKFSNVQVNGDDPTDIYLSRNMRVRSAANHPAITDI
jgi:murein DD-endopeptidase MepM/ murein hydrolase activator NlpD